MTLNILILARQYATAKKAQRLAGRRGHFTVYYRLADEVRRRELELLDAARSLVP